MLDKEYLTFDDVSLVPQYSTVMSRKDVDLSSGPLSIPFISANMDSVTGPKMCIAMDKLGGLGILHRFDTQDNLINNVSYLKECGVKNFGISIGVNGGDERLLNYASNANVSFVCVDVAHGHHTKVFKTLRKLDAYNFPYIIAGNVVTATATYELIDAGVNVIKVGVGGGSACSTRVQTGHGVPQLSAILECANVAFENGAFIIADGGIRAGGDCAKALAAGAHFVMLGRLLAGSEESPAERVGNKKIYRGSASFEAQSSQNKKNPMVEGVQFSIDYTGPVSNTIKGLCNGVRSALSYSGARNLKEFKVCSKFIRITHNSYIEGTPHGAM